MCDESPPESENCRRVHSVENAFGPSGSPLYQGRLRKQGRRKEETKMFLLFNDVLVYGSIVLNRRWHKKLKILSLEHIMLEDMDDCGDLRNQWLIRTPRKSFFVSAGSHEEKRAWMDHIEACRADRLQGGSCRPGSNFAVSWIPDRASYKCMRCLTNFTVTRRRHHCRRCGFLVCNSCSRQREVIDHIHPTKRLRVCRRCHGRKGGDASPAWGGMDGSFGDDDSPPSSDEEEEDATLSEAASSGLDIRRSTWDQPEDCAATRSKPPRPHTVAV